MSRWYWWRRGARALPVRYDMGRYKTTVFWSRIIGVRVGHYFIGVIGTPPSPNSLTVLDDEGQP